MNMERLNSKSAPWLWNHQPDLVLGSVEKAWQGADGRGYVRTRWSPNTRLEGSDEWKVRQNWEAGIISGVSFMYSIDAPVDFKSREGVALVTAFTPMEVSTVSIAADYTVGKNRSITPDPAAPAASNTKSAMENDSPSIDLDAVRAAAAAEERQRVASITSLTREHGCEAIAQSLIEAGTSEADASKAVLAEIAKRSNQPATAKTSMPQQPQPIAGGADIGLSDKEARSFSFVRAINALANPGDLRAREAAGFELEVSRAVEQRTGRTAQGIMVPNEVMQRDLTVATASAAGDLVATDYRGEAFIELLRNRMALNALGITTLSGLTGPVAIPRQTGAPTAYWVAEKGAPSESNPTVDQLNMSPRTVGAYTDFSRKLMLQASLDVEQMVRRELATVLALEIDRVGLYGLGNTNQPLGLKLTTGINTKDFGADAPTYPEVVAMETEVNADNADIGAMAYLTNSAIYGGFKTTEKASSTGMFILEPGGTVNGYPVVRSNQVASGDVFFGVWTQLILGLWSGLDLTVDPYSNATQGGMRVIALQDVDFAVRHPESFCRGNNTL
jgi:HK97 family phage major capsid protein